MIYKIIYSYNGEKKELNVETCCGVHLLQNFFEFMMNMYPDPQNITIESISLVVRNENEMLDFTGKSEEDEGIDEEEGDEDGNGDIDLGNLPGSDYIQ